MEELRIINVRNAAYSPNYNPIEGAISMSKLKIKRERLRAVILSREIDLNAVIMKSFMEIEKKVCVNFI